MLRVTGSRNSSADQVLETTNPLDNRFFPVSSVAGSLRGGVEAQAAAEGVDRGVVVAGDGDLIEQRVTRPVEQQSGHRQVVDVAKGRAGVSAGGGRSDRRYAVD